MDSSKKLIIACGFDVDTTDIVKCIKENESIKGLVKFDMDHIPTSVKSGIMYGVGCRGGLDDVKASQSEMETFYKKFNKDTELIGFCKTIWYNHHFIALEITSSRNHRFY